MRNKLFIQIHKKFVNCLNNKFHICSVFLFVNLSTPLVYSLQGKSLARHSAYRWYKHRRANVDTELPLTLFISHHHIRTLHPAYTPFLWTVDKQPISFTCKIVLKFWSSSLKVHFIIIDFNIVHIFKIIFPILLLLIFLWRYN